MNVIPYEMETCFIYDRYMSPEGTFVNTYKSIDRYWDVILKKKCNHRTVERKFSYAI